MSTVIRTLQDLTVEEHTLTVPLVWGDPADHRTIDIFARVVAREGGESLPYLVFLQGGPGMEAPRPFHSSTSPAWLDEALAHYRLVLLDQRGTGLSTPVGDHDLARGAEAVAEHLTHLRADAIVRDCEAMRQHLGATTWSVLGQSFGGFTTLAYLSTDAASLEDVFITGGLSAVGRHPDDVYALCYDKMRDASERYYRRFLSTATPCVDSSIWRMPVTSSFPTARWSPARACGRWGRRWAPMTGGRPCGRSWSAIRPPTPSGTT